MAKSNKENKFISKIKQMRETSKGKAILKLIGWLIFFLLLFIFLIIASFLNPTASDLSNNINNNETPSIPNPDEQTENTPTETLASKTFISAKNNLISKDYNYNFEITINNLKYTYNGTKTSLTNTGYKESPNGIIKYLIDDTGIYSLVQDTKSPLTDLYENIESNYLDLEYLSSVFSSLIFALNLTSESNYLYEATSNDLTYQIAFSKDLSNLLFINILGADFTYYLNFN